MTRLSFQCMHIDIHPYCVQGIIPVWTSLPYRMLVPCPMMAEELAMGGMQLPYRLRTLLLLPPPHHSAVSLSSSWSTLSTVPAVPPIHLQP